MPDDPQSTETLVAEIQVRADRLLQLIRSIEPDVVTWDTSGRSRHPTVTSIGLRRNDACLRMGVFETNLSLMFTAEGLPDPSGLFQDGVPFLDVTSENISTPEVAQLIREAFARCRADRPTSGGGLRSALGRIFGGG